MTLEEMKNTFWVAAPDLPWAIEAGLRAVLDKHVREMLANAHAAGARNEMGANKVDYNYADRILKSVKGE